MSVISRVVRIVPDVSVGLVALLFNLHGTLRYAAHHQVTPGSLASQSMEAIAEVPRYCLLSIGPSPLEFLYRLMYLCFIGCDIALACMVLLALRRLRVHYLWLPALGLVIGTCSIVVLAWAGAAVVGILWILSEIWKGISWVLAAVWAWIAPFGYVIGVVVGLVALIALMVWILQEFGPKGLFNLVAGVLLLIAFLAFARFLFRTVLLPFIHWLGVVLQPILHFLGILLGWLAVAIGWLFKILILGILLGMVCLLGITGLVGSIGRFAIDQIRAAWASGESVRGATLALFSIGTALALIFLVSAGTLESGPIAEPTVQTIGANSKPTGSIKKHLRHPRTPILQPSPVVVPQPPLRIAASIDRAWDASYLTLGISSPTTAMDEILPSSVGRWVQGAFRSASAPIFDALLLLLAVVMSLAGIVRGLFLREEREPKIMFYSKDLIVLVALPLFVVLAVLAANAQSEG